MVMNGWIVVGLLSHSGIILVDDSCLYITAPIDEVDAPHIRVGMPARITLDAFPGQHFQGRVRCVAPYVMDREKQARTVDVDVDFINTADTKALLTGIPRCRGDPETHDMVLRIPSVALLKGNKVLVFDPTDDRLHARRIEVGLSNWDYTEARSSLTAGARVTTELAPEI